METAYPRTVISEAPVLIGNGYTYPFTGKMDDICIWLRALTQQEIVALYEETVIGR